MNNKFHQIYENSIKKPEEIITHHFLDCLAIVPYIEGKNILDVIVAMEKIAGLERIRISSIEPTTIPIELMEMMTEDSKLCRYLHIPIQSASDSVLKDMQRKYSYQEFADFILKVKSMNSDIKEWPRELQPNLKKRAEMWTLYRANRKKEREKIDGQETEAAKRANEHKNLMGQKDSLKFSRQLLDLPIHAFRLLVQQS